MPLPQQVLPDFSGASNALGNALGARIERNRLMELVPGALKGDQNSLNQLTAYNPQLGLRVMDQQQRSAAERQALVRQDLIDTAGMIVNMPEDQLPNAWGGIRAGLIQRNPELADRLPEQYEPGVLATAKGIVGMTPKAAGDAQIPDVIEIGERYNSDPRFREFYDKAYKPQTYSGSTVVQLPGGGFGIVQGGSKGGSNTIQLPGAPAQFDPALQASVAGAEAQARAEGTAAGEKAAKAPVLRSYEAAASAMRDSINSTATGGVLGARGQVSKVTDYQGVRQFDNRVQQLSTELRTIFRIAGEGTLSDREQAQYGLQLPDVRNDPAVNEQIMADLETRINARLSDSAPAPVNQGGGASGSWGVPEGWSVRKK